MQTHPSVSGSIAKGVLLVSLFSLGHGSYLRPTLLQCDVITTLLTTSEETYFQIRAHPGVLGVRTSTYLLGEDTVQPITLISIDSKRILGKMVHPLTVKNLTVEGGLSMPDSVTALQV